MKKRRWSLSTLGISLITLWIFLCFYVFLYCKLVAVGYRIEEAKKGYEELIMLNQNYRAEILMFASPENLLKTARMSGMELVSPSEWCYVNVRNVNPEETKIGDTAEAGTR